MWDLSSLTRDRTHVPCIAGQILNQGGALEWFLYLFIYLFIYFWPCWVFVAAHRLSLVKASGGYPLAAVCGLLPAAASLVAECGL